MSDVCLRVLTRACTRALLLSVAEGRYDRLMSEDNGMEFWSTSILRVFQVLLCLSCAYLRFFRANLFFGKLKGVLVNFCLACILGYCASLSLSLSLSVCVCVCVFKHLLLVLRLFYLMYMCFISGTGVFSI